LEMACLPPGRRTARGSRFSTAWMTKAIPYAEGLSPSSARTGQREDRRGIDRPWVLLVTRWEEHRIQRRGGAVAHPRPRCRQRRVEDAGHVVFQGGRGGSRLVAGRHENRVLRRRPRADRRRYR
jgi:hypothetical protein